ncbi:hypothetical protein [Amycolatopsis orientalis]|uniref:hypothetical protein n=1 Tax=Amycolatopsis orientalis TaxID=31958 RepID=UPI001F48BCBB|nr:hypothetical protein [Amycolatopsis orientalis]
MPTRPRVRHAVISVVLGAALIGCTPPSNTGQARTAAATTSGEATSSAPTTTEMPYLTTTPTLEVTGDAVKPGTKLKFGEQAIIPFYSRYAKGVVGLTVTVESVKAPDADIDGLPLKEEDKAKLRGKNFFFVREKLTNVDGTNLAEVTSPILTARTKSGGWPGSLLGMGKADVTGCEDQNFAPKDFSVKGAVFESCRLHFGVASDPITSLSYTSQPYESADSRAVTWRNK